MTKKKLFLISAIILLAFSNVYSQVKPRKKAKTFWDKLSVQSEKKKQPTAIAGVRGVDEPEGIGDSSGRDWAAVEKIEKFTLQQEEIERFVSEGRLK